MSTRSKATALIAREHSGPEGAEQRLKELAIKLPVPPRPFGTYVEGVQTGKLLFLTGMLPTEGRGAKFIGRVGAELEVEAGRKAAHLAAFNVLAVARQHLGSLDKVTRVVRLEPRFSEEILRSVRQKARLIVPSRNANVALVIWKQTSSWRVRRPRPKWP